MLDNILEDKTLVTETSEVDVIDIPQECTDKEPSILDFSKFPHLNNRKEVRAFEKVLRRKGKSKNEIENLVKLGKMLGKAFVAEGFTTYRDMLEDGEMVKLNIDKMYSYPDWEQRQGEYRKYIEEHEDTIFTVRLLDEYRGKASIVSLVDAEGKESPWIFSDKDLLVYDNETKTFTELWLIKQPKPEEEV